MADLLSLTLRESEGTKFASRESEEEGALDGLDVSLKVKLTFN